MIQEVQLADMRRDIARAKSHKPYRLVDVDARTLELLIDEIERLRSPTKSIIDCALLPTFPLAKKD